MLSTVQAAVMSITFAHLDLFNAIFIALIQDLVSNCHRWLKRSLGHEQTRAASSKLGKLFALFKVVVMYSVYV